MARKFQEIYLCNTYEGCPEIIQPFFNISRTGPVALM